MLKSYRQERATELRRRKVLGAVFLIILTFAFSRESIFGALKKAAHFIAEPIWQISGSVASSAGEVRAAARSTDDLLLENANLKKSLEELTLESKTIKDLRAENERLKEVSGRTSKESRILAKVLIRPPHSSYDTYIIDRGSDDGVTLGMRALIAGDFLVGTVTAVAAHTSTISLSSTPGITYDAMLSGKVDMASSTAPEFEDEATTTLDIDPSSTSTASSTSSSTSGLILEERTVIVASTSIRKPSANLRTQVTFTGIGGGGFRAFVPKQMPIAKDEAIALSTPIQSFLGVVSGVFIPPSGSLKEVYGALPIGLTEVEWVSLAPAIDIGTTTLPAVR